MGFAERDLGAFERERGRWDGRVVSELEDGGEEGEVGGRARVETKCVACNAVLRESFTGDGSPRWLFELLVFCSI